MRRLLLTMCPVSLGIALSSLTVFAESNATWVDRLKHNDPGTRVKAAEDLAGG
ncbi:MAG: hypothetical protein AB1733_07675 [Thermodesulfobacteriota bacterium]